MYTVAVKDPDGFVEVVQFETYEDAASHEAMVEASGEYAAYLSCDADDEEDYTVSQDNLVTLYVWPDGEYADNTADLAEMLGYKSDDYDTVPMVLRDSDIGNLDAVVIDYCRYMNEGRAALANRPVVPVVEELDDYIPF